MGDKVKRYFVLKKPQKWRWDGDEKVYNENPNQIALAGFAGSSYGYLEIFDDEETIKRAICDLYHGATYFPIEL